MAIAAIHTAKIHISERTIVSGLAAIEWPARFQNWDERTIIDGAHNAGAAARSLRIFGRRTDSAIGASAAHMLRKSLSERTASMSVAF